MADAPAPDSGRAQRVRAGASGEGRTSALRRYPALAWLVGAGLLALLLPSGLTLPQSGPSTLAEYAPVPGAGEGSADLGELASSGSSGVGAGGGLGRSREGGEEPEPEPRSSGGRFVRKAGTKRCVGDPPRQTEDPLSPPCIAFFDGDNGGATAKGVTKDEVVVTAVTEVTTTDQYKGQEWDCAEAPAPGDEPWQDTLCKAYMRYFNDRYQTYNRTVRLHSIHRDNSKADAATVEERHKPFAHVASSAWSGFEGKNTVAVGYIGSLRKSYANNAPYLITFRPDYEDNAALSASFVCQKLHGRLARYAGDPLLHDDRRKFGYWANQSQLQAMDKLILEELDKQCGVRPVLAAGINDGTAAARLRADGVTTVIINVGTGSPPVIGQQANAAAFRPEWFIPAINEQRAISTNFYGRLAEQSQWASAFGITLDYRRGDFKDQMWYRAYKEGCPQCPEPQLGQQGATIAAAIYDAFTMLFYGIQAAGPRLTPQNIDKGLHAISPKASNDPFLPAAYFAPGNWSFVKDATAIWWDPSGIAPGSSSAGCYRLPAGGSRYRAGEWPAGDDDIRSPGPCQGDTFPGG